MMIIATVTLAIFEEVLSVEVTLRFDNFKAEEDRLQF